MERSLSAGAGKNSFVPDSIPSEQNTDLSWKSWLTSSNSFLNVTCLEDYTPVYDLSEHPSEGESDNFLLEYISSEFHTSDTEILSGTLETELVQGLVTDDLPGSSKDAILETETRQFLVKRDVPYLKRNGEGNQTEWSQAVCETDLLFENSSASTQVVDQTFPLERSDGSKLHRRSKVRGRPPKHEEWVDRLSESPFVLNNYKRRKPRKYRDLRYSKYCHICNRNIRRVPLYYCANIEKGLCRKGICLFCIGEYRLAAEDGKGGSQDFICPHCMNSCPTNAQCQTYLKTNLRRKAQVLISRS